MPYEARIIFGEEMSRYFVYEANEDLEEMEKQYSNPVTVQKFDTEAERDAYLLGLHDMNGWLDYYVLGDNQ